MKKITLLLIMLGAFFLLSIDANAQLSERVNNPSTFRMGTRPTQGTFAFSLDYSYSDNEELTKGDVAIESYIPLINIKYYFKDDIVLTLGYQNFKKAKSYSGDIDPDKDPNNRTHAEWHEVEAKNYLKIGAEKHFLVSNILDPYVAVGLPIGYMRESKGSSWETENTKGGDARSKFSFYYGFEVSVGVRAFVADLPLSLGVEFGMTGFGLLGDKYKVEGVDGNGDDYTYYTTDMDKTDTTPANSYKFSSLSASQYDAGGYLRLSIAYYFR